jgi:hypothetical protein
MIDKISRSKRKDPTQEKIVSEKDVLNQRSSKVIDAIIALKKAWNGGPSPAIGINEKINLTQPMPDQVISFGTNVANEFSDIINDLKNISNLQDTYSAERSNRISDRMKKMDETQKSQEMELASAAVNEELEKFASNKLTRIWSHIIAPFAREEGKWDRLKLLRGLADLEKYLEELDDKVLNDDVFNSVLSAKQVYRATRSGFFEPFNKTLNDLLNSSQKELKQLNEEYKSLTGKKIEKPSVDVKTSPEPEIDLKPVSDVETVDKTDIEQPPKPRRKPGDRIPKIPGTEEILKPVTPLPEKNIDFLKDLHQAIAQKKKEEAERLRLEADKAKASAESAELEIDKQIDDSAKLTAQQIADKSIEDAVNKQNMADQAEAESVKLQQIADQIDKQSIPDTEEQLKNELKTPVTEMLEPSPIEQPIEPKPKKQLTRLEILSIVRKNIANIINEYKAIRSNYNNTVKSSKYNLEFWKQKITDKNTTIGSVYSDLVKIRKLTPLLNKYKDFLIEVGSALYLMNSLQIEIQAKNEKKKFDFGKTFSEIEQNKAANEFASEKGSLLKEELSKQDSNDCFIVNANKLTRWLKRTKEDFLSGKQNKEVRLHISRNIVEAINGLQDMMDLLEKRNVNFSNLISIGYKFYNSIFEVFDKLYDLAELYNGSLIIEKKKHKKSNNEKIPIHDISELKQIKKLLETDRDNLNKLSNIEKDLLDITSEIEKLKSGSYNE